MKIPRREHYERFIENISGLLSTLHTPVCFYLYGSYTRPHDFVPGRSDIDGGFIFNSFFALPKEEVKHLARCLDSSLIEAEEAAGISSSDPGIRPNLNLMDRGTIVDGRFLAYDDTYVNYIKVNARVVSGPDFIQEMNGMNYKRESLRSAAYNLRKARNGLLTYFVDSRKNPDKAKKSVLSSIGLFWGTPKKLLETCGIPLKEIEFEKDAFFDTFKGIFPNTDVGLYERAQELRRDASTYYGILEDMPVALDLALDFLNGAEKMIQAYAEKMQYPTRFEVNSLD